MACISSKNTFLTCWNHSAVKLYCDFITDCLTRKQTWNDAIIFNGDQQSVRFIDLDFL